MNFPPPPPGSDAVLRVKEEGPEILLNDPRFQKWNAGMLSVGLAWTGMLLAVSAIAWLVPGFRRQIDPVHYVVLGPALLIGLVLIFNGPLFGWNRVVLRVRDNRIEYRAYSVLSRKLRSWHRDQIESLAAVPTGYKDQMEILLTPRGGPKVQLLWWRDPQEVEWFVGVLRDALPGIPEAAPAPSPPPPPKPKPPARDLLPRRLHGTRAVVDPGVNGLRFTFPRDATRAVGPVTAGIVWAVFYLSAREGTMTLSESWFLAATLILVATGVLRASREIVLELDAEGFSMKTTSLLGTRKRAWPRTRIEGLRCERTGWRTGSDSNKIFQEVLRLYLRDGKPVTLMKRYGQMGLGHAATYFTQALASSCPEA